MLQSISVYQEGNISQIKCETSKDLTLVKLAKVVQAGWPDQQAELDPDLHAFWIHRWCHHEWHKNRDPKVFAR